MGNKLLELGAGAEAEREAYLGTYRMECIFCIAARVTPASQEQEGEGGGEDCELRIED